MRAGQAHHAVLRALERHVRATLAILCAEKSRAIRAGDFAHQAPGWFRETPLRQLHVKHIGERLAAMLQSPLLLRIHTLEFNVSGRRLYDHEAVLLAACANLANLRNLSLGCNQVGPRGMQAILGSPHLQGLQNLRGVNYQRSASLRAAVEERFGRA